MSTARLLGLLPPAKQKLWKLFNEKRAWSLGAPCHSTERHRTSNLIRQETFAACKLVFSGSASLLGPLWKLSAIGHRSQKTYGYGASWLPRISWIGKRLGLAECLLPHLYRGNCIWTSWKAALGAASNNAVVVEGHSQLWPATNKPVLWGCGAKSKLIAYAMLFAQLLLMTRQEWSTFCTLFFVHALVSSREPSKGLLCVLTSHSWDSARHQPRKLCEQSSGKSN